MSGKLYSLNTRCYIKTLELVSSAYAQCHNTLTPNNEKATRVQHHAILAVTPLRALTPQSAAVFLHALIKSFVSEHLAYAKHDTQYDTLTEVLFGEGVKANRSTRYFIEDFLTVDEVTAITDELRSQIDRFLPYATWNVTEVIDMGTMVAVTVAEDLRILEWNQLKGYTDPCAPCLELDISEMLRYMRSRTNQLLKPMSLWVAEKEIKVLPGDQMDFKSIVLDTLVLRYPFLRQADQLGAAREDEYGMGIEKNLEVLMAAGVGNAAQPRRHTLDEVRRSSADFIHNLVRPVIESYALDNFLRRLDDTARYHVEIDIHNRLRVTVDDAVPTIEVNEDRRLKELAEAYLRGDYLPTKEREEAERYVQSNQ